MQATHTISLFDTTHLELLRPAMVDWLLDCCLSTQPFADEDSIMRDLQGMAIGRLAKLVDRKWGGGLADFAETEGFAVEHRSRHWS